MLRRRQPSIVEITARKPWFGSLAPGAPGGAGPELFGALIEIAARTTGRSLALAEVRALRLRPGDYLLAHHDRLHDDHPVELVLDLSPASVPGAEVHYRRRGQVYFRVPCVPGSLAIVERGPTVSCNHTYVSKRNAAASIVRIMMLLRAPRPGHSCRACGVAR